MEKTHKNSKGKRGNLGRADKRGPSLGLNRSQGLGADSLSEKIEKNVRDNAYANRKNRYQELYPDASLPQLRGHPRKGEKPLSEMTPRPISKVSWGILTPKENSDRILGRNVYRLMKEEQVSFAEACRHVGISPKVALRSVDAFKKVNGRYVPKSHFMNEVPMNINTNGQSIYILVKDSRHASTIGRYQNAVKQFLEHQDVMILAPFEGKSITDSKGTRYVLETQPSKLYEIRERREDEEFYSIYGG